MPSIFAAPIFLAHGTADPSVPHSSSVLLAETLTKLGIPVELVLFEGEGHHIYRTQRNELFPQLIAFFEKHLSKPAP